MNSTPTSPSSRDPAAPPFRHDAAQDFLVVGIGASAGGLEALERFFKAVPMGMDAAFVVVQHLSPDHKSLMADLLGKHTSMPVREAEDGMALEPGTVAMVPPRFNLEIESGRLRLRDRAAGHSPNLPINLFFRSLADNYGERAVCVVLSGTGSDGRLGVEAVKEAGGVAIAQDPATSRFDGMPLAAISTGLVDAVLAPEAMPAEIGSLYPGGAAPLAMLSAPSSSDVLSAIHAVLLQHSGVDFAQYKPATVLRRISKRMSTLGLYTMGDYLLRLEADAAEVSTLFRELLINVTEFFRDPEVFESLEARYLVPLVARAGREPLRLWVPGCSSGQEAYSLAMLLSELGPTGGFKIFATDIASDALEQASTGQYEESELTAVTPARLKRFFKPLGAGRWEVDRELRRHIVFARHDLSRDPPFTRLDLVSCRNLLIYLAPALQRAVISNFAFALKPEGLLVLGSSETIGEAADRFRALEQSLKIFQHRSGQPMARPELAGRPAVMRPNEASTSESQQALDAALQLLVDRVAPAAVLVNERQDIMRVFGNADRLLILPTGPVTLQLGSMLPPELRTVTSMAAHRALSSGTEFTISLSGFEARDIRSIRATPLQVGRAGHRYLLVAFERAPPASSRPEAMSLNEEAQRQLLEVQRELELVRESLQATIEELETSNEELQATNEELLAANEELQSTNEELQSVNEELNTVNAEHQAKITELLELNADLDNLFNASTVGTLFLDAKLNIRRFTPAMTEQLSLLERDIGRPIEHITHQFMDFDLVSCFKRVQATTRSEEREILTHRGQRYLLSVVPYLTLSRQVSGLVATFVDVTALRSEQEMSRGLQQVIDSLGVEIAVVGQDGRIRYVNRAWLDFARNNGAQALPALLGVGADYLAACASVPELREKLEAVLAGRIEAFEHEYPCDSPTEKRWFVMHVGRLADGSGAVVSHVDVSRHRRSIRGGGSDERAL